MDNMLILLVAVLAVVAIAGVVLWTTQRRRSGELRRRFGPEYERTVGAAHDKREAESELRARQERVDALEIRPLEPAARDRFAERWREVQAMFVDDPGSAVDQADTLIGQVMRARGYPVGDFEQRAADISVNHPHVVDHYRTAHSIAVKRQSGDGATEQLRQAFVHYRALFADLLEVPGTHGTAEEVAPTPPVAADAAAAGAQVATEPPPAAATPTDASPRPTSSGPATESSASTQEPAEPVRRAQ